MNEIVASLFLWIATHSQWDVPPTQPQISYEPAWFIAQATGTDQPNTLKGYAAYDDDNNIVLVPENFDPNNVKDRAALMHELVHYLQDEYPYKEYQCRRQWEVEAYELTNLYMEQAGELPWTNRLTILFHSMCNPHF